MSASIRRVSGALLRRWRNVKAFGKLPTWGGYTSDAMQLADVVDCSLHDLDKRQQRPELVGPEPSQWFANWYLPTFESPYYGGMMTILRFAAHMRERGVRQRMLICGHADVREMHGKVVEAFPMLADAEFIALDSAKALAEIPPADLSFATLWTTAYVLLRVENTGLKFYFMQDYEPLFYPAGSTYAQAELTYRFGFYGIANTRSLRDIYAEEFGGGWNTEVSTDGSSKCATPPNSSA